MLFSLPFAKAQNYSFQKYTANEGLVSANIKKTLQDKYGFIWISTQDGLYRFDGVEFELFKKNIDNHSLSNNFIYDFCYDSNNFIYVASFEGGIDKIDVNNLKIEHIVSKKDKALWQKASIIEKLIVKDNFITIYNSSGLFTINILTKDFVKQKLEGFDGKLANIFFVSNKICIAVSDKNAIFEYEALADEKTIKFELKEKIQLSSPVVSIKEINKKIHVLLENKLLILNKTNSNFNEIEELYFNEIKNCTLNDFVLDKNQNLYIATSNGIKYLEKQKSIYLINYNRIKRPEIKDEVTNIFFDNQNNIWLCTFSYLGRLNLNKNYFRAFSGNNVKTTSNLYTLLKSGNYIYACGNTALYKTNLTTGDKTIIDGSTSVGLIHYITNYNEKYKIVSTDYGMALLDVNSNSLSTRNFIKKFAEWNGHNLDYFNNSINCENISYWASENNKGLIAWDSKKKLVYKIEIDIEGQIHELYKGMDGGIWLLCNKAVYKFDSGKKAIVDKIVFDEENNNTFNSSIFFGMYEDSLRYWFATYGGGINIYDKKTKEWKYITEKNGLSNNSSYSILDDNNGSLWVSTNYGINKISKENYSVKNFYVKDGLNSSVFEEKCYFKNKDTLYFGGMNGFTEVVSNADLSRKNTSVIPIVKKLTYYQNFNQYQNFTVNNNQTIFPIETTSIDYDISILDFKNQHKYKLYYKLSSSNFYVELQNNYLIRLNNLTFGKYAVDLKMIDGNNKESYFFGFIEFKILPKWYQTLLFKILVALAIAALLFILYNFRIRQLKRILTVRKKISADLHDDIGSTLSSINMYSQIAQLKPSDTQHIQTIQQNTQEALQKLDDIVWATNPKNDQIKNLVERIKNFANEMLKAKQVNFVFKYEEAIVNTKINEATRQNLFLICKEAVNNIAKYAQAKNCIISLSIKNKTINCTITDDGIGFDTTKPTERNGILNMQLRTQQLKGKFTINSEQNKGTTINVQLPL